MRIKVELRQRGADKRWNALVEVGEHGAPLRIFYAEDFDTLEHAQHAAVKAIERDQRVRAGVE